jgi:hypothetical protein
MSMQRLKPPENRGDGVQPAHGPSMTQEGWYKAPPLA